MSSGLWLKHSSAQFILDLTWRTETANQTLVVLHIAARTFYCFTAPSKQNMWFVVTILTFTSSLAGRFQLLLDLTWHTDSCTSLLQRPPRSVDVASCTDPGQLKILHRSRASSSPCYHRLSPISPKHFFMPANCYATNAMTSNNKSDQFAGRATIEIYQLAMT